MGTSAVDDGGLLRAELAVCTTGKIGVANAGRRPGSGGLFRFGQIETSAILLKM